MTEEPKPSQFAVRQIELSDGRHVMYGEHEGHHYFRFKNAEGAETKFKLSEDAKEALVQLLTEPQMSRWIVELDPTGMVAAWKNANVNSLSPDLKASQRPTVSSETNPTRPPSQPGRVEMARAILKSREFSDARIEYFKTHDLGVWIEACKAADAIRDLYALTNGTEPGAADWRPVNTYDPEIGEVLVWCDEGLDIASYHDEEPDSFDSMGHDAGWWGVHQPMDPGRSMGNPLYTRPADNQPWAWMPKPTPPYGDDGEPLFPRALSRNSTDE